MTAFLPPISAITRLRWRWPGTTLAARSRICRPTAQEPVKAIVWMRGSATSALPASSPPGSSESASSGTPPACSASTTALAHAGVCSAGFEHDGVAGRERGGDHAGGDRQREVPRRDHAGDAARRRSASRCARRAAAAAGGRLRARARRARSTRGSRSPRRRRRRPPPTACRPRGRRARRARGGGRAGCRRRARARRRARRRACATRPRGRAGARSTASATCCRGRLVGVGDDPVVGDARVDGGEAAAVDDVLADQHRDLERELGVQRGECGERLAADGLAAQLEQRFVGERGHGASRSSAVLVPLACGGEEGVVGGVLEQAAHEVGHAGDEVADRAVGADATAGGGDRGLRVVAQPAQDLELEVGRCRRRGRPRRRRRRRSSAGCARRSRRGRSAWRRSGASRAARSCGRRRGGR